MAERRMRLGGVVVLFDEAMGVRETLGEADAADKEDEKEVEEEEDSS